ncbi:MAG: L,D-transpeptidase family protein [Polyangiaceae bacterium]|nr:L,D-transpeptidase family protein [Polyangiaceae bacterium]
MKHRNLARALAAAALFAAASLASAAPGSTLGAPGGAPSAPSPGPSPAAKITEIRIDKSDHKLELVAGADVVRTYKVALGPGGSGPKLYEGDRRTPVGTYRVTGRIKGLFHQFLVVSYPNEEDRQRFAELKRRGEVPAGRGVGHGIGIHGVGGDEYAGTHKQRDWTLGCIALDDDEIDEVARLVPDGTKIVITD